MSTSPLDFGLPPRFSRWYPGQWDAVLHSISSSKRFTVLNVPTGGGKSAIYTAAASILGGRTAVLTSTKLLQDQLIDADVGFESMGMVKVMGQNNYPCIYLDNGAKKVPGCDEGPCHAGYDCEFRRDGCTYYDAVRRSTHKNYVAFNYRYWMTTIRYSEPKTLGKFDNLVLDEAHDAAEHLADFVRIHLNHDEIRDLLNIDTPDNIPISEWVEWAEEEALPACKEKLEGFKTFTNYKNCPVSKVRSLTRLEGQLRDLANASSWQSASDPALWVPGASIDWIIEESPGSVIFSPVWASGYAEKYLFNDIKRVILTSATVTPRDVRYLGIPKDDISYRSFPSPFPVSIRPIIVTPGAMVSRNMTSGETKMWINRIDALIDREGEVKGIIHAVSYSRARLIKEMSRHKHLMVLHSSGTTRGVVARFKGMKAPAILVSPSVETGYDFPMDLCRYQIIAKVPFVDGRPAIVKARNKEDRRYIDHVTMKRVIQMAGRGVRSVNDFCRTYIVDDNWSVWFYPRNRDLVPQWFKRAIIRTRY